MADDTRVIPEMKGTFTQGTFGALYVKLYDQGGSPVDGVNVHVAIRTADTNSLVVDETPVKLARGVYLYDWQVPGDQAPGAYNVTWSYTVGGVARTEEQQVVVAEATPDGGVATGIMSLMRIKLEQMLSGLQAINLNFVQANDSEDFQTYSFPFQRWNQSAGVKVYRNQKLVRTGFQVDYHNGVVVFDTKQLEEDQIHVSCVFRFFSDDDLDLFLLNGLNSFNIFPPHTGAMSYGNLPQHYVPPVLYGSAIEAIRTFMQALIWPKNRALFETHDGADKAFDQYNTIKENYEKQWQTLCDQKKLFPYAGLHKLILIPQYNLPGGRARFYRYLFGGGF